MVFILSISMSEILRKTGQVTIIRHVANLNLKVGQRVIVQFEQETQNAKISIISSVEKITRRKRASNDKSRNVRREKSKSGLVRISLTGIG